MTYGNDELKAILNDSIIPIYHKNPIILSDFWDDKGERNYIDFLRFQYEKILTDFNKIFNGNFESKRILEISSFLGVVDIALAKIGSEVYTYDIPEFQKNENLIELYLKFNIRPSSGYLKDVWQNGLTYPDNHFDAVILSEVIEHLNFNPLPLIQEINRILKKDGILYITTPNQVNLINRIKIISGRSIRNSIHDSFTQLDQAKHTICGIHWREYTLEELIQLLDSMGFGITTAEYSPMTKKNSSSVLSRIFYASGLLFPGFAESITVIAKKKEFRPMQFWFNVEYIKYIKR